jgi:beta-glucosidase-like glycosyl hydrolase
LVDRYSAGLLAFAAALLAGHASQAQTVGDATAHPELWPTSHSPAALTGPATEARVRDILSEGKDQGDAKVDEKELIAKHAQGYPAAIDAGALTVMASFSSWQGIKHHGNKGLLTDALKIRGKMGFEGFVVGDWNGHGQVAGCSVTDCAQSINAGLDMFMAPDSWKGLYETTLKQAKDGTIPAARLDDAVRRILRVKYKLGLFTEGHVNRGNFAAVGAPDHLAVAREAVSKSLVLLKNNGNILPVKPGAKVLVAGPGADNMAMQSGGWTISWQGHRCCPVRLPERPDDLGSAEQGGRRCGREGDAVG